MLKFLKRILFGSIFILIFVAFSQPANDEGLIKILRKLEAFIQLRPQQKIYLHLDKPRYATGEDIWFSTYLVNAADHKPDSTSKVVYVELFDMNKKLIQRRTLHSPNGISKGDFHLADSLAQGNYVIRAYTNYMKNVDEDFYFLKEIQILNAEQSNSKSKAGNDVGAIDVQFFPEGGNLLAGIENRIAFKAINQYGSIALEGDVVDENNTIITSFKSEHGGMGVFKLTPSFGKHYHAKIKNNNAIVKLPAIIEKGYLLRTIDAGPVIKVIAYSNLKKFTNEPCRLYVVAQSRGVSCFAAEGEILNTSIVINIHKSKLPSGITQITLFDGNGVPQCERLIFSNRQNNLRFTMAPNKATYAKREKVDLDIQVINKSGKPVEGYFSMSVYDESKIKDVENHPTSIINSLLLTSDLKGHVEDPGYYLKDTLSSTKYHVDLLMMTHGWRRFSWKTILRDTLPALKYYPEEGITISGTLLKTLNKQPSANSELKILTSNRDIIFVKTDSLGRFYADKLIYYDSTELFIQTDNAKGKKSALKLQLNPFNTPPPLTFIPSPLGLPDGVESFLNQVQTINRIAQGKNTTVLKEVEIRAKKVEEESTMKLHGMADATIKMKDIPQGYTDILQVLQGRVAGLMVTGAPPTVSIQGGGEPLFLLNDMPVDANAIINIPVGDVESIDVLKGVSASIYGGRGGNGVIAVYLKKGSYGVREAIGVHNLMYPGFYKAREFYSPKYDVPQNEQNQPDIRNTLYWNPSIRTGVTGSAHVSFFTSDVTSQYKIILEGISTDGTPGAVTHTLEVK